MQLRMHPIQLNTAGLESCGETRDIHHDAAEVQGSVDPPRPDPRVHFTDLFDGLPAVTDGALEPCQAEDGLETKQQGSLHRPSSTKPLAVAVEVALGTATIAPAPSEVVKKEQAQPNRHKNASKHKHVANWLPLKVDAPTPNPLPQVWL